MSNTAFFRIQVDGADKLEKDLTDLTQKANDLRERKKELNKELKNLDKSSSEYASQSRKLNKELAKTDIELKETNKELRTSQKRYFDASQSAEKNAGSINQLRAELRKATAQYDDLSKEQRENTAIGGQQLKRIQQLRKSVGDLEEATGRHQRSVGNYGKAFKGLGGAIKGALASLFAIQTVIEGARMFIEFARNIGEANKRVTEFTGLTGDAAKNVSNLALSIQQTFGVETTETLKVANTLANEFGISVEEALEKINLGFAAGLNNSGEFIDILREYPSQLASVGLSADETFAIINQTVKEGIYSDKGIDAIKEAGIRLRELAPVTREALDGIGLSSAEIEKSLRDGSSSIFDVVKQVSGQLSTLPPQSAEVGAALADIFGGAGEDAGLRYLKTLKDINLEFNEQTLNLTEAQIAQLELQQANENLNSVFNKYFGDTSIGFQQIKASATDFFANGLGRILEGVQKVANGFIDLYNESLAVRTIFKAIGSVAETIINFQITGVKTLFGVYRDLGKIIKAAFTGNFSEIPSLIGDAFNNAKERVIEFGKDTYDSFADGFEEAKKSRINPLTFNDQQIDEAKKQQEEINEDRLKREQEANKKILELKSKLEGDKNKLETGQEVDGVESPEVTKQDVEEFEKKNLSERLKKGEEVLDATVQLLQAGTEKELNELIKRRDQGLITEEEFAKQSEVLKQKQAKKEKNISLGKSIVSNSLAITQALTSSPFPINLVNAAVVGAKGIAEITRIRNQQFAEGGFTGDGFGSPDSTGYKVAGVVHENEYVVPERLINEPEVMSLERKRLSSPSIAGLRGFANGGFTSQPANVTLDSQGLQQEIIAGVSQSLSQIRVVNVATDTSNQSDRVKQIQNINTF